MMSFTKFLDIAQEDNGSISGTVNVSGTDLGSHCFQEGECYGLSWCFPSRVSKPQKVGAGGRSPQQSCQLLSARPWVRVGCQASGRKRGGGIGSGSLGGVKRWMVGSI